MAKASPGFSIYMIGSLVYLNAQQLRGPCDYVPATVIAVTIRKTGVQYQVSWWSGNDRREAWVEECEISTDNEASSRERIGFKE